MATIIIPARKGSTRLYNKPHCLINGIPLIKRVYQQAVLANVGKVYVASDCRDILAHVPAHAQVPTSEQCKTGTDRVAEAARLLNITDDVILNVQGDMPFIPSELIRDFAYFMETSKGISMGTVAVPEPTHAKRTVSIVLNQSAYAINFSRNPSPCGSWNAPMYFRHVGLYGFRPVALQTFTTLPFSAMEEDASLEQLRVIEHDPYPISVMLTTHNPGIEINTPQDLIEVNNGYS